MSFGNSRARFRQRHAEAIATVTTLCENLFMVARGTSTDTRIWQARTGVTPQQIAQFCQKCGLSEFSLFGSIVRDDFGPDSDVDVLIRLDPNKPHGGWDWVDMIEELQAMFGRKVDLTSPKILDNPFFQQTILRDLRVIYAQ